MYSIQYLISFNVDSNIVKMGIFLQFQVDRIARFELQMMPPYTLECSN